MSRHRLKIVIVIVACAAVANPVLAGWHDSGTALSPAPEEVSTDASCPLVGAGRGRHGHE